MNQSNWFLPMTTVPEVSIQIQSVAVGCYYYCCKLWGELVLGWVRVLVDLF